MLLDVIVFCYRKSTTKCLTHLLGSEGVMVVAERTYTFRAPGSLAERIREASALLDDVSAGVDPEVTTLITRELLVLMLRDGERFHQARGNQSAFMRETIELLVAAAEKVASDREYVTAYADVASDRTEAEADARRAARAHAARRVSTA
jgi:hypothetical protein